MASRGSRVLKHEREARWPRVRVESLKHEGEACGARVGDFVKKRERESSTSIPSLRVRAAAHPAPFYSWYAKIPLYPLLGTVVKTSGSLMKTWTFQRVLRVHG
ncbi:hypothetical protein ACLB2K_072805 [Fragaria x ananassa]